jgi:hypothetical protein
MASECDASTPLPPAGLAEPPWLPERTECGPAARAEARGDAAQTGGKECGFLYVDGSVGPGCPAVALGCCLLLWGLLQGVDPHTAHLLRLGLASAYQLPLPLHHGFHDAQCALAGSH